MSTHSMLKENFGLIVILVMLVRGLDDQVSFHGFFTFSASALLVQDRHVDVAVLIVFTERVFLCWYLRTLMPSPLLFLVDDNGRCSLSV